MYNVQATLSYKSFLLESDVPDCVGWSCPIESLDRTLFVREMCHGALVIVRKYHMYKDATGSTKLEYILHK